MIKIQLNSLEALERLIGGDSELEIDIRNSVAQAFAKKHLKRIISEEMLDKIKNDVDRELRDDLFNKDVPGKSWLYGTIKNDLKREIKKAVESEVKSIIHDEIRDAMDKEFT